MKNGTWKKVALLCLVAAAVILFFSLELHHKLTFESLKESRALFQEAYQAHPARVILIFAAIYIPVIALNLPGGAILGLAAGALFGVLAGTVLVSFLSTFGACLAFLLSRTLFRDAVQRRLGDKLARVNQGVEREGAFYLFSMRLIPVIPFFAINMLMGLTPMRLLTFAWVSQIGMLPGTFVYVNAGSQLGRLDSLKGIFSPGLLLSFALLGIFPLVAKKILDLYRRKVKGFGGVGEEGVAEAATTTDSAPQAANDPAASSDEPAKSLAAVVSECDECGACVKQCAFLTERGTPKALAQAYAANPRAARELAMECSLCGLCAAVCPQGANPFAMFMELRREAAARGEIELKRYKMLLGYEARGNSRLFSYYGLPKGCDTVLFPGCNMPGSRPSVTWELFRHLGRSIPNLGIVLDCCNKPSHDLGRQEFFESQFGEMRAYLTANGVKRVLTACPNCFKVFKIYGDGIEVRTVYEELNERGLPEFAAAGSGPEAARTVTIHDPCPLRLESGVQEAVRKLATGYPLAVEEMRHKKKRTLCCGEGGAVGFHKPELAKAWGELRAKEAKGRTIMTYCAGCANFLSNHAQVFHVLDLIFSPTDTLSGQAKVVKSPFTYLKRLQLKRRFKRELPVAKSREGRPLN